MARPLTPALIPFPKLFIAERSGAPKPSAVRLWGAEKQGDYSNLTLDGFQAGHLYLKVTPSPALVNAENPYDPAAQPATVGSEEHVLAGIVTPERQQYSKAPALPATPTLHESDGSV